MADLDLGWFVEVLGGCAFVYLKTLIRYGSADDGALVFDLAVS